MNKFQITNMPTPVSLGIIVVCAAIFLGRNLSPALALWPLDSGFFAPWQLVTYAFLHGSFNHLFFNMFAVWMFGPPLEKTWGSQRFAVFYATCVVGAGIIQLLVQQMEGGMAPEVALALAAQQQQQPAVMPQPPGAAGGAPPVQSAGRCQSAPPACRPG